MNRTELNQPNRTKADSNRTKIYYQIVQFDIITTQTNRAEIDPNQLN